VHLIPALPGQWYPEKTTGTQSNDREVNGLCLATDIEGYTAMASQHAPQEIWGLLKSYYQVLGYPVSANKGIIANIQGDAMMALWIDSPPDVQRQAACLAALEIELAVERFNETSRIGRLPTRIGLHEGNMVLGSGESGGFRFYNPFGDAVNTASRIEGVNKFLGTKILASASFATSLSTIVTRPVGVFRLKGREESLALLEIVGTEADVSKAQHAKFQIFSLGLAAFGQGDWDSAVISFQNVLSTYGEDGPSRFYLKLALAYQHSPPEHWDGIVTLDEK
jgi:adenylate cyclase